MTGTMFLSSITQLQYIPYLFVKIKFIHRAIIYSYKIYLIRQQNQDHK